MSYGWTRRLLKGMVWLSLACPLAGETRQNVLLVTIDTLRADHLGCYGSKQVRTPNLDALAARGTRFRHVTAPVPLTLPSHASILTGVYPLHHGIRDNTGFILAPEQLTLAEILSSLGWETGAFVGSFVLDARFGLNQGFDRYVSDFDLSGLDTVAPGLIQKRAGEVKTAAVDWLRHRRHPERPFFAWVHFYDPHAPYEPPGEFARAYARHPYGGEVAYVDQVIGELLDDLKSMGQDRDTIVIVTSDHGESLGEHGEKTHGFFIYEATQAVPLIWWTPGVEGGRVVETPVRLIDIAPTILQQLGQRVPASMQGAGLLRALLGREPADAPAYAESYYPRLQFGWSELRSLYRPPYKYIEAPEPELYDLSRDPGETTNLYSSRQSLGRSLRQELMDLIQRYGAGGAGSSRQLDAETAAALASLGYVSLSAGTSVGDRSYLDLPDPKRKVGLYERTTETYTLLRTGKYREALASFETILKEDPGAAFVYHPMGMAFARMGRHQEAVTWFRRAESAFPADAMLYFNLGSSLLRLQNWAEAEAAFRKAVELDPAHFRARANLAGLWLQAGQAEAALKAAEEVLATHPNYETALVNAGMAAATMGRVPQAIRYLEQAAALNPENPRTLLALADLNERSGNSGAAAEYRRKAAAVKPR
jgi:arylsulfatase A-like enzyme/Flp pilus assembly protein TadD